MKCSSSSRKCARLQAAICRSNGSSRSCASTRSSRAIRCSTKATRPTRCITSSAGAATSGKSVELKSGTLVGELGFLTPERTRTQAIECLDEVHALMISYEKVTELYFQNPSFGLYFLKLISQRLLQNVQRAEQALEARNQPAPA
jgi:CRP-like cAMP-binding protein